MTAHAQPTLTSLSSGAGCGCKLGAADILPIVGTLPAPSDPRLLVGSATGDDAAVFRIGDDVTHASLGDGVVIGTEPGGIVVVRFAGDGSERKLMADYAPIRKR